VTSESVGLSGFFGTGTLLFPLDYSRRSSYSGVVLYG
jgi:hypothetical protein